MSARRIATIRSETVTLQNAVDAFLSSPRCENPNTRRAYVTAIDKLVTRLGRGRELAEVDDNEIGDALHALWSDAAPALPSDCERHAEHAEHADHTSDLPKPAIDRQLSRRDIPLREKTLWRMLYETAARASEILALDVEQLDLANRQAPVRSKGGQIDWVHWGTGTAHLLPRLLRLPDGTSRTTGPLFLASRKPVPARQPAPRDICPHTGRPRLGYDRARILLHATPAGGATSSDTPPPPTSATGRSRSSWIMAKTRHKSPRTAMRYVNPSAAAVAEITELLDPPRRQ